MMFTPMPLDAAATPLADITAAVAEWHTLLLLPRIRRLRWREPPRHAFLFADGDFQRRRHDI